MPRLHLLNKAPDHPRFQRCLASIGAEDTLVLLENGVLAVSLDQALPGATPMALAADLSARGLTQAAADRVSPISMEQLVALTEGPATIISW